MRHYLRLADEQLKHTGFPTTEAAAISAFKHADEEIQKLTKAHLRTLPLHGVFIQT